MRFCFMCFLFVCFGEVFQIVCAFLRKHVKQNEKMLCMSCGRVLPLVSSSSIVALESVDSFTWDPSLFFDIKFLLLKFLETSMVVKMAPYEWITQQNVLAMSLSAISLKTNLVFGVWCSRLQRDQSYKTLIRERNNNNHKKYRKKRKLTYF